MKILFTYLCAIVASAIVATFVASNFVYYAIVVLITAVASRVLYKAYIETPPVYENYTGHDISISSSVVGLAGLKYPTVGNCFVRANSGKTALEIKCAPKRKKGYFFIVPESVARMSHRTDFVSSVRDSSGAVTGFAYPSKRVPEVV